MKNLLLLFLLVSPALGQRYDNFSSTVASASGIGNLMQAVPNATITVCNFPGTGGTPCTNKATTYTSQTLVTPCGTSSQVVLQGSSTCQATGDILGNFGFWAPPTKYTVCIGGNNVTTICGTVTATVDAFGNNNPGLFTGASYICYICTNIGGFTFAGQPGATPSSLDANAGGLIIPSGAAIQFDGAGTGGYCTTNADSRLGGAGAPGNHNNCVSFFGIANANVTNSAAWGSNVVVRDATGVSNDKVVLYEGDATVNGTPQTVFGMQLTIAGTGTLASCVACNAININGSASPLQWGQGLEISDGCCLTAMQIGPTATSGTGLSSMPINFAYFDSGGTRHTQNALQMDSTGNMVITPVGVVKIAGFGPQAAGTAPTITGTGACATTSTQKGTWAGQVTCTGTTGASTLIITTGVTAPNGTSCWASDVTHTLAGSQSAVSATACTMTFTSVTASDVLTFGAATY